jgi:hypothetical protein
VVLLVCVLATALSTLAGVFPPPAQADSTGGSQFFSVPLTKIMDTRDGTGGTQISPMSAGTTRAFSVAGVANVPTDGSVTAVVLDVTALNTSGAGTVVLFPDGTSKPSTTDLLFNTGQSNSNTDIVEMGSDGKVSVFVGSGSANIVINVEGYFAQSTASNAANFNPVTGVRLVNSQSGVGFTPAGLVSSGTSIVVPIDGKSGIPSNASDVVLNISAINPTGTGSIFLTPDGAASNGLAVGNFDSAGQTSVTTTVPVATDGAVDVSLTGASADINVDVEGYFQPVGGTSASFAPDALRVLNTRSGTQLGAGQTMSFMINPASPGTPTFALHFGVINATHNGGLEIWPTGQSQPTQSQLHFDNDSQDSSLEFVQAGAGGYISVNNTSNAPIDLVVDLQGTFPDPNATDSQSGLSLGSGGWVYFPNYQYGPSVISNSQVIVQSGTATADGCTFPGASADSSTSVTYVGEVGFNASTCQEEDLAGTLSGALPGPSGYSSPSVNPWADNDPNDAPVTDTAILDSSGLIADAQKSPPTYKTAYANSTYVDPVDLNITSMAVNVTWPLGEGNHGTVTRTCNPYHFEYDGWQIGSVTKTKGTYSGELPSDQGFSTECSQTDVNSDFGALVDGVFGLAGFAACGFHLNTTATFKHDDTLSTYLDGHYAGKFPDSKSGDCSDLVSTHQWVGGGSFKNGLFYPENDA